MYIKVLVEIGVKNVDKYFIYRVPKNMQEKIQIGIRVLVPFNNRQVYGFVLGIMDDFNNVNYDIKDIVSIIDEDRVLNDEMILLGQKITNMTLCSMISAYQVMLPKALKARKNGFISIKKAKYIILVNNDVDCSIIRGEKQKQILESLRVNGKVYLNSDNSSSIKSLVNKGLVKIREEEVNRYRYNSIRDNKKIVLNNEQNSVKKEIVNSLNTDLVFLLHGVTGSGKTEVYMQVIEEVIKLDKCAIMLVPEISLTPQIVGLFYARFGSNVAILHSGMNDSERYDEYRKIKSGEARIVVGARSAVFAPLNNIGVIIIDEEHVSSYKQDNHPKYHARDVAILRGKYHNCPVILGSATPSLESYARAFKGVYRLLTLSKRANNKELPKIKLIDMKEEIKYNSRILSRDLIKEISFRLERKEQVILLLNRRGYSSVITCRSCGNTIKCPKCDISLTYHKTSETLRCHYCGYGVKKLTVCPSCKSENLVDYGVGTEKLVEELNSIFSDARIVRMDTDTTTKKSSYEKIILGFENLEYDILVGTQMIAKGLDFPLVTLVGVINADMSLNIPDFRSCERTFQLLSQVSGRAGRDKGDGLVIIQGYNVDNYSIKYACHHDYLGFFQEEMAIRRKLKYSPYYYLTKILITSLKYDLASSESKKVVEYLKSKLSGDIIVLGPSMSNVLKINNIYHFQCIIKYKDDTLLNKVLMEIDEIYKEKNQVNVEIDKDPLKL